MSSLIQRHVKASGDLQGGTCPAEPHSSIACIIRASRNAINGKHTSPGQFVPRSRNGLLSSIKGGSEGLPTRLRASEGAGVSSLAGVVRRLFVRLDLPPTEAGVAWEGLGGRSKSSTAGKAGVGGGDVNSMTGPT